MHLVILVARQHRVIEDDKSHVFMFRPGEKEGQPEAVKLRLAEDGDDIADFGRGAVGVWGKTGFKVDRFLGSLARF